MGIIGQSLGIFGQALALMLVWASLVPRPSSRAVDPLIFQVKGRQRERMEVWARAALERLATPRLCRCMSICVVKVLI